jgi:hypothetical protein
MKFIMDIAPIGTSARCILAIITRFVWSQGHLRCWNCHKIGPQIHFWLESHCFMRLFVKSFQSDILS